MAESGDHMRLSVMPSVGKVDCGQLPRAQRPMTVSINIEPQPSYEMDMTFLNSS